MKNTEKNIELIEKYLDDRLDEKELSEFNNLLNTDPEFNQLFFDMDLLVQGIRKSARKTSVEEKLDRLEQILPVNKSVNETQETIIRRFWNGALEYKYAIAAVFTLLVVAAVVVNRSSHKTMDPSALMAQYFVPYENVGNGIVRGNNNVQQLQQALMAYDRGNYRKTIELFESIPVTDENSIQIWMYGGNAYLATGNIKKAEESFKNIIEKNTGFVIQAKWYLSLSYLKEGNTANARKLLDEIKAAGKYKSEEAGEILKVINN